VRRAETLIIGGGIAGAASALALHKAGIPATVYEADPRTSRDAGAFLTLAGNGMRALQQIGAATAVTDASSPLRTMRVCRGDGTELAAAPLGDGRGPGYRYLTRADLCRALQDEAHRRGIGIHRGKQLTRVDRRGAEVVASFDDGTSAAGEVLIGADGLRSTVRTVLDPAAVAPRYVGQRVFYGYSTDTGPHRPADQIEFVRGAAAFGSLATTGTGTWWFARVDDTELRRADLEAGTTARWKAELATVLAGEPAAIVQAAHRVLVTNAYDLPGVRTWHRDGVVVIGDAAHAASPATGQGASMALEDAVVLAKALRDQPDTASAFACYERLRRDRVEANIAASAGMSAPPGSRPPPARSPAAQDADLEAQLDWDTPIDR
jgi:2-polyprenyl-6-methoxyphenol hydroxylase-like FAD-dependent oxidoreductase